jgi:hypothetical protein
MLDKLRATKNTVVDLYKRGDGVSAAIASVLESDDEMNMMYLSSEHDERTDPSNMKNSYRRMSIRSATPAMSSAAGSANVSRRGSTGDRPPDAGAAASAAEPAGELEPPSHDEVEALLETYYQSVSNVNHEVDQLRTSLDHQEHTIELTLDLTRNSLLRLDMIFQIMNFSVTLPPPLSAA